MSRRNKGVHSSPATSGIQNLPVGYEDSPRRKDDEGFMEKALPLWTRSFENRENYKGLWTEDALATQIWDYFTHCFNVDMKPSKSGLALWLNLSREQYNQWDKDPGKYGFKSDMIKKANMLIEQSYIDRIEKYPSGNIFLLKSKHEYVETTRLDVNNGGATGLDVNQLNDQLQRAGLLESGEEIEE